MVRLRTGLMGKVLLSLRGRNREHYHLGLNNIIFVIIDLTLGSFMLFYFA